MDRKPRVLLLDGCVIKRFRVPADNQEKVLSAFQEEDWPSHVDDPLPPKQGMDCKERLKFTIRRLNAGQKDGRICFFGDGTGEGICWEALEAAAVMKVRRAA